MVLIALLILGLELGSAEKDMRQEQTLATDASRVGCPEP
jgi:hypothetical protein